MIVSNRPGWFIIASMALLIAISCKPEDGQRVVQETPDLDKIIEEGLRESFYTGAVLIIGNDQEILVENAYGFAELYDKDLNVVDEPDSMTVDHLFDVASLTKIFATTFAVMKLHSENLIDIDTPVADYVPEFNTDSHSDITVRQLLNHTSGLLQWYPTFYEVDDPSDFTRWLVEKPLISEPGTNRNYSDLGFMVLAQVVENITDLSFEEYLNQKIYEPAGLNRTAFNPDTSNFEITATSHGNPFERKMVYEDDFGYQIDVDPEVWDGWRDYTLKGEVNDGNAFHTFKGVAGHAGLFSTGRELATLLQIMLNDGKYNDTEIFSEETIEDFTTRDSFDNGLGWAMDESILNANELPDGSLGHTGFTGTNFVMSPDDNLFYIFLTNRQHPGANEEGNYPNLSEIRARLSDFIFSDSSW